MNAPNEGSPRRPVASKWISSPSSQGSSETPRDVAERAVTAALVHWDELERSSLEALAGNDSADRDKLELLRSAETWLRGSRVPQGAGTASPSMESVGTGGGTSSPAPGPHPTPEDLFDFGRGPGAAPLQIERRLEIEAHLAECAICDRAAASLVTTPPVPILVDKPRPDLPAQIQALPKVDQALLARICGSKSEDLPAAGAPAPPSSRLTVPSKLEVVHHTPAPPLRSGEIAASLPSLAGKSAPNPQEGDAEAASPPQTWKDSEREALDAPAKDSAPKPAFRLLSGAGRGWQRSGGMAAAALVLGVLGFSFFDRGTIAADPGSLGEISSIDPSFPEADIVRSGVPSDRLTHPRERVLSRTGSSATLPSWAEALRFELAAPIEGAESYRFDLYHSAEGGAFSAGQRVATLESSEPRVALDAEASATLEPGSYTWEAWANVNGLDRSLGERDFRLVENETVWATLNVAEKSARSVRWLYEQGFESDARLLAETLPSSPARDRYLEVANAPVR